MNVDGQTRTQTLPFPKEDKYMNMVGCMYDIGARKLEVGQKIDMHHLFLLVAPDGVLGFNINNNSSSVLRRETLDFDGKSYNVLVVSEKGLNGQEIIRWQLESGEVLKAEMALGSITFVRESKEKATEINTPKTSGVADSAKPAP